MFFPASTIIAKHHPDLVGLIDTLDAHLHSLVDVPIRIDATADMLNVDPDTLARLFRIYEAEGTLTPVVLQLCPDDLDALQPDESGGLWCEICERQFDGDTCIEVDAYLVQQALGRPAGTPTGENVGQIAEFARPTRTNPAICPTFSKQRQRNCQRCPHLITCWHRPPAGRPRSVRRRVRVRIACSTIPGPRPWPGRKAQRGSSSGRQAAPCR